jgi:ABC-type amino acid transport substrate-binding protein
MRMRPLPSIALHGAVLAVVALASDDVRGVYAPRSVGADTTVEIAVEDAADPWSRRDGTGYANDVVRAAYQAVGVRALFRVVPYTRCKRLVTEGAVVACFSMSRDSTLAHDVVFAKAPLFVCNADYFENRAKPLGARRPEDVRRGTVVSIVLGYEYPESVHQLARRGIIRLEPSPSEEISLRKLAAGRVDAAIINYNDVKNVAYLSASVGAPGMLRPAFRAGVLESFIGFSRRHPRGAWARERFDRGLRTIAADGRLKRIEADWVRAIKP